MDDKKDIHFDKVQFQLVNPTPNDISFNLFNTNVTSPTPTTQTTAFPNSATNQITVGASYDAIVYCSSEKTIWVSNLTNTIRIINAETREIITTLTGIFFNGAVYVSSTNRIYAVENDNVHIFNCSTNALITTANNGGVGVFTDIAYAIDENLLFITDTDTDSVIVFNPVNNSFGASIALGGGSNPTDITYVPTTNMMYSSSATTGLQKINCATQVLVGAIGAYTPTASVYASNTDELFFWDSTSGNAIALDAGTDGVNGTVTGITGGVVSMDYSSVSNIIWLGDWSVPTIRIIDTDTYSISSSISVPVSWKGRIVYAENVNAVFVTADVGGITYMQVLDASNGELYVGGSTDYNEFIQDSLVNPKKIDRIMIYATTNNELLNPLLIQTQDANGQSCLNSELPNIKVSENQLQGYISQLNFSNLVLNSNTSITYTVEAYKTVNIIIYYRSFKRVDLLAGKSIFPVGYFDIEMNDTNTYTKEELEKSEWKPAYSKMEEL